MSTFTENYSLIQPDEEDYYDVNDFNENMDTLDAQLFATEQSMEGVSEKIGSSGDDGTGTVFGKLNQIVSSVGGGISLVKSIQKVSLSFKLSDKGGSTTINPVDASRCVVIMEYLTNATVEYTFSYTLTNDSISVTTTSGYSTTVKFGFWIIEFY